MLNVNVKGIAYDESNTPIILLADTSEERILPIWVGITEAQSIALAIEKQQVSRPLTHDLILNLCTNLNVSLSQVVINDLKDNTFYAELHFLKQEEKMMMDARPSDAIALALRTSVPIYITGEVINQMVKIQELMQSDITNDEEEKTGILKDYKKTLH
ncbi:MAG: bifunctional nuclease family protein [Clostridiales bacterium]|nr:bifunctional nuclease family protein [Clostridiales bacterium]MCF8023428.1 bifunctional nuclease family protein [Clostridiales bacterium]